ncbi:MAG: effector binding domain-containing protein [Bacteroidota bacterium]
MASPKPRLTRLTAILTALQAQRLLTATDLAATHRKVSLTFYCVYTNFSGDKREDYDALLGCQVSSLDEIPDGMIGREIVVGSAQKRTVKGDIRQGQAVVQAWQGILAAGLDRSFTADFEVYDERAMHPENAEVDIFVAVN